MLNQTDFLITLVQLHFNHFPVETMTDFIRRNESTLVECLDTENGFATCLLSKGVLNAEQHSRIINRISYPNYRDQNKALLDMLLPILITESSCNSFMEALIDTNQQHVFNFIAGLICVSTFANHGYNLTPSEDQWDKIFLPPPAFVQLGENTSIATLLGQPLYCFDIQEFN